MKKNKIKTGTPSKEYPSGKKSPGDGNLMKKTPNLKKNIKVTNTSNKKKVPKKK